MIRRRRDHGSPPVFRDRRHAGELLADRLRDADLDLVRPLVLALPRGGVPVADVVARRLGADLELWVARKVGAPGRPEYGVGAIAEGGGEIRDDSAAQAFHVDRVDFEALASVERAELERRVERYRGNRPRPEVRGRDVLLVDDGLATGVTAIAAVRAIDAAGPRRLVLAVPVAAPGSAARLAAVAGVDDVVTVLEPDDFVAVGRWYDDFAPTDDDEVLRLLAEW